MGQGGSFLGRNSKKTSCSMGGWGDLMGEFCDSGF